MKKSAIYTLLTILAFLLSGCTLSMEEWEMTEEKKGYEEPETVTNDFFTLTYQYKPTTRSLTDTIQSYIVQVDNDSVLYFLDNTPEEWLPKVGGQVVSCCCNKFPTGLMGRVLSVEKEAGLIKVVTTHANLDDIYEDFDLDFDADIFTSKPEDLKKDSVQAAKVQQRVTRSTEDGGVQTYIVDWAMYNAVENPKKKTREDEAKWKEDIDQDTTKTVDILVGHFGGGSNSILTETLTKLSKGWINTAEINIYSTEMTHMKKEIRVRNKSEYTETTTTSGIKISGVVGHNLFENEDSKVSIKMKDIKKWVGDKMHYKEYNEKLRPGGDIMEYGAWYAVALPKPIPFSLLFQVKPILEFDLGLYGEINFTYWKNKSRTITYTIKDKKKKEENKDLSKEIKQKTEGSLNVFGTVGFKGGVEGFIGFGEKVPGPNGKWHGVGIGAYVNVTLNASLKLSKTLAGDYFVGTSDEFFKLNITGEFGAKMTLGGWWSDFKFIAKPFNVWKGYTLLYHPKAEMNVNYPLREWTDAAGHLHYIHTISYKYTQLGLHPKRVTEYDQPVLFVYTEENPDSWWPAATIINPGETSWVGDPKAGSINGIKVKRNTEYMFYLENDEKRRLWVIPGVLDRSGDFMHTGPLDLTSDLTLYPEYKVQLIPKTYPSIEYYIMDNRGESGEGDWAYVYQTEGKQLGDGRYFYEIQLPFTLRDAASINEYWKDWGLRVNVQYTHGTQPYSKTRDFSFMNSIKKSGKYCAKMSFATNHKPTDDTPVRVSAYIYLKLKNGSDLIIGNDNADDFSYLLYKRTKKGEGNVWLVTQYKLDPDLDSFDWGFEDEHFKSIPVAFIE
jgi:hypothetical protein